MKIFYAHPHQVPSDKSNGVHVVRMCSAWASLGHQVTLMTGPGEADKGDIFSWYGVDSNFRPLRAPIPWLRGVRRLFAWAAARSGRQAEADIFYTRDPLTAAAFARVSDRPLILELHYPPSMMRLGPRTALVELLGKQRLALIVVISNRLRELVEQEVVLGTTEILVAHDGADSVFDWFPQLAHREPIKAVYTGSLGVGRGIEVIESLAKSVNGITFDIYGGTKDQVRNWQARTSTLSSLRFRGHVRAAQVGQLLLDADILLAPYQSKIPINSELDTAAFCSPLKVFEYMAAGRAILCSDLPILREVLEHEANALLCSPTDIESWTMSLTRLRDNPVVRQALGEEAKRHLETHYSWSNRAKLIIDNLPEVPSPIGVER